MRNAEKISEEGALSSLLNEREDMTEEEKALFLHELKEVCGQYFETEGAYSADIARTPNGFSVCVLFNAVRVKKFRKPR